MQEKRPRLGVIGAGFISSYHIPAVQQAGADIVIISGLDLPQARRQAVRFGIPAVTEDYHEVLARPDVDAVMILTPDATHAEVAIAAAEAGKPMLLQKPMATNSADCQRIIEAAEKAGVYLYVSFMHRYFAEVQAWRALLQENPLGRLLSIRQRNATEGANWAPWFYSKSNVGGGVVMQLGVHGIDLIRYLFGEIEAVRATTALLRPERTLADGTVVHPDNEDLALAWYRLASSGVVSHEMIYNEVAGTDRFRMEVYGEQGTAWLRSERGLLAYYAPEHTGRKEWIAPDLPQVDFGLTQHRHFLDMLQGKAPRDSSPRDGLVSIQVAEAIYRAAESGRWEPVQ